MARCSFVPELDQLVSMATFPIGKQMVGKVFKNCIWIKCSKEHLEDLPTTSFFRIKTTNMVFSFFE